MNKMLRSTSARTTKINLENLTLDLELGNYGRLIWV